MSNYATKSCITCNKSLDVEEVLYPSAVQCLECIEFESFAQAPDDLLDNQGTGGVQ